MIRSFFTFALIATGSFLLDKPVVAGQNSGTPQHASAPAQAADITGNWRFVYQTDGEERENSATFKVDGDQVTGKYNGADVQGTFKDGDVNLAFPYDSEEAGMKATLKMKGKLKDGKIVGNWQFADNDGTFVATRTE